MTRRNTPARFCSTQCGHASASEKMKGRKLPEVTRQRMSEAVRRRWQDPEQRAKFTDRDYAPITPETRAKMNEARAATWHSPEAKAKRSAAMQERWRRDHDRMTANLAESRRTPEAREKFRQWRLRRRDFPPTDIELLLQREFDALGLAYEFQKPIFDRFIPDFTFEEAKLLVQADGEHWHRFERNRRYDEMLRDAIEGTGWRMIRFDARDIHADPAACARRVAEALA